MRRTLILISLLALSSATLAAEQNSDKGKFQIEYGTTGQDSHWTFLINTETGQVWMLAIGAKPNGGMNPVFVPVQIQGTPTLPSQPNKDASPK